jgi:F-type H+-transporting ATPase subunit delta
MAIQTDAVSRVYARSLFELAEQAGGQDTIAQVADELDTICNLLRADARLREFFSSPIVAMKARGESLRKIFTGRASDLTLRFLLVLNEAQRLGSLERIAATYEQMEHEKFGRVEVDVTTAEPLDASTLAQLKAKIQKSLGKEPVLHLYTNEKLIGGIQLRIGDQLIDSSVATRLKKMRTDLLQAGSSQIRANAKRFIHDPGAR